MSTQWLEALATLMQAARISIERDGTLTRRRPANDNYAAGASAPPAPPETEPPCA
jgi:hypothetical protein